MFHIAIKFKYLIAAVIFTVGFVVLQVILTQHAQAGGTAPNAASLENGFLQMYNMEFAAAHKTFEQWEAAHPDDPLGAVANAAAYLFAEFDRMHILEFDLLAESRRMKDFDKLSPDPTTRIAFEGELEKADGLAAKILAQSAEDTNALFARILADGLRGNYAALVEKRKLEALNFLKSSRTIAEKLIAIDPAYHDAYLAIGIENYVLGLRSAPTRWMLRLTGAQTSKDKGIANLEITAEKGRYLAPFARLLLVIAYLRDHDTNAAKKILTDLVRDFPRNHLYQVELERLRS